MDQYFLGTDNGRAFAHVEDSAGTKFIMRIMLDGSPRFYDDWEAVRANTQSNTPIVGDLINRDSGAGPNQIIRAADTRQIMNPVGTDWQKWIDKPGLAIANSLHPADISYPAALFRAENGTIYLGDHYGDQHTVDPLGRVITGTLPIPYANPQSNANGYAYTMSIAVSPNGDKIALGNTARDLVRVFNLSDGAVISNIGVAGGAGNPSDGRVNNVYGNCLWIDEDTLAVPSYSGGNSGRGGVSTWDISTATATLIAEVMVGNNSGAIVGQNLIRGPFDIQRDPLNGSKAFICEYQKSRAILIEDVTAPTWAVEDIFGAPANRNFSGPYGFSVSPDGAELAFACNTKGIVVGVDRTSRQELWGHSAGTFGLTGNFRSMCHIDEDFVFVADWSARGGCVVPRRDSVAIPYEALTPTSDQVVDRVYSGIGVLDYSDQSSPFLTVPISDVGRVGEVLALFA